MITITVGTNGRLGNQMFQYASLMGIADKQNCLHGINYKFGSSHTWKDFPDDTELNLNTLVLPKAFHLSALHCEEKFRIINENNHFHFNPDFFNTGDDVHLYGYFQTDKYFRHIESRVRSEFTFKKEIVDVANDYLKDKRSNDTVSIHVRRGDYLQFDHHGVCDLSYYIKALEQFTDKNYNFIVMTDDIEWAKSTFSGNDNFFISESKNQFIDMCTMTLCNHNIIANSTFSWWGAWLNQNINKKVIAPHKWFGKPLAHLNTYDLIPANWIRL
jgi:hypothetical protein